MVQKMPTGGVEIAIDADEIRLCKQFFQSNHFHRHLLQEIRWNLDDIRGEQFHAERVRFPQHRLADITDADHSQRAFAERAPGSWSIYQI